MSVFKRPLAEGEILEDSRFSALNTQAPGFTSVVETVQEVVTPEVAVEEEEKEVQPVEPVAEPVVESTPAESTPSDTAEPAAESTVEAVDAEPVETVVG